MSFKALKLTCMHESVRFFFSCYNLELPALKPLIDQTDMSKLEDIDIIIIY